MKSISGSVVLFMAALTSYSAIVGVNYATSTWRHKVEDDRITISPSFAAEASKLCLVRGMRYNESQPVLFEFFDYQCPACRISDRTLQQISTSVNLVRLQFPLPQHPAAALASRAAFASSKQFAFEAMHKRLISQSDLSRSGLFAAAKSLKLDMKQFSTDFDSEQAAVFVRDSLEFGTKFQINSTPSYIVRTASGRCMRMTTLQKALIYLHR